MDKTWASKNLEVIRTLMERAAVYRRALAPIMIVAGGIGSAGALVAWLMDCSSPRGFSVLWLSISLAGLAASFLQIRRQALKAKEPFWSPPTRRVSQALAPAFFAGLAGGCLWIVLDDQAPGPLGVLPAFWLICYGCGLHAAGFFMVRGIKLFGWVFVLSGSALVFLIFRRPELQTPAVAHYIMGTYFGLFHLAYGVYLHSTEKTRNPL